MDPEIVDGEQVEDNPEGDPPEDEGSESEVDTEGGATDEAEEGAGDGDAEDDGEEAVISLGEPEAEEDAPGDLEPKAAKKWAEMRVRLREAERKLKSAEARAALTAPQQPAAVTLGPEPTMEDPDILFDPDKYRDKLKAWVGRKAEVDAAEKKRADAQAAEQAKWQGRIAAVDKATVGLKVRDHEEAAAAFDDSFSLVQRGIIMGGPDDPKISAALRYALGKNPKFAKELAAISDPIKFAFKVADVIKDKLTVTTRKAPPLPEKVVRSTVAGSAAVDNQLDKLLKESERTGDMTKVTAYRRQQREAGKLGKR